MRSDRVNHWLSRRQALVLGGGGALLGALGVGCSGSEPARTGDVPPTGDPPPGDPPPAGTAVRDSKAVALVRSVSYDPVEVHAALAQSFDLLGGLDGLVRGKTVTIKPNLTGIPTNSLFGRAPGEVYITHDVTVRALTSLLFDAGAVRVRIVESIGTDQDLATVLSGLGWDLGALSALGSVEYENTRNLGSATSYVELPVASGNVYSHFVVNRQYHDTDVLISLAKLKMHAIGGVTLTMKNLYGMTPLSLYGTERDRGEVALGYRLPMHEGALALPGQLSGTDTLAITSRVPRTVVDQVSARPIDLAIVDGISALSGGEGPWNAPEKTLLATDPGVLVVGWNPVATDAVATAVMGFDPLGAPGTGPYPGENYLALAQARGLGDARVAELDLRGLPLTEAVYPYPL